MSKAQKSPRAKGKTWSDRRETSSRAERRRNKKAARRK